MLNEDLVKQISKEKNEANWMFEKRLQSLEIYNKQNIPNWGPDLKDLDFENLNYYSSPNVLEKNKWEDLPEYLKDTFQALGIKDAEKKYFGGIGAQYDSGVVYHSIKESLKSQGVIFENMDTALKNHEDLVKKYFMSDCVKNDEHKFVSLHGAVWSGGTFIYVPKNVKVSMPLQAYFRMNKENGGQFEHTLIIADEGSSVEYIEGCSAPNYTSSSLHAGCVEIYVMKNAHVKYISIENWSNNTYNLNTKKALVYESGTIEWMSGNFGSKVTMLYPTSILIGDNSKSLAYGVAIAGANQIKDIGNKVIHLGKNTNSIINSKSISKDGGNATYRGFVQVGSEAENTFSTVKCDGIILDKISSNITIPVNKISRGDAKITHEAKVGKLSDKEIFYFMSRGYNEEEAKRAIVGGFMGNIIKKLPLEYAVEFNKLIDLEMKNI